MMDKTTIIETLAQMVMGRNMPDMETPEGLIARNQCKDWAYNIKCAVDDEFWEDENE